MLRLLLKNNFIKVLCMHSACVYRCVGSRQNESNGAQLLSCMFTFYHASFRPSLSAYMYRYNKYCSPQVMINVLSLAVSAWLGVTSVKRQAAQLARAADLKPHS